MQSVNIWWQLMLYTEELVTQKNEGPWQRPQSVDLDFPGGVT